MEAVMLSGQVQTWLARGLADHLRPDWDSAGCYEKVAALGEDPRPPFELIKQAIGQASIAANRTPECLLWPLPVAPAPAPSVIREAPHHDDPECSEHGSSIRNAAGDFICCVFEQRESKPRPVSPAPPSRRCGPPPSEIKAAIEADFQKRRADRAREGAQR